MEEKVPHVIVLGGCNGSGKTTSSRKLLAGTLNMLTFVNADQIAAGLSGFSPGAANLQAGRIMLARIDELIEARESFAFETTLSGKTYVSLLKRLAAAGYRIEIYYFWLNSVELSIFRVANRVAAGGHDVPEATLRQRYLRSIGNFYNLYRPLADIWDVYDNSEAVGAIPVASGEKEITLKIADEDRWTVFEGLAQDE